MLQALPPTHSQIAKQKTRYRLRSESCSKPQRLAVIPTWESLTFQHSHRRTRNVSSSAPLWPTYQNRPAYLFETTKRQPKFDTTSQVLHAQKNKQAFYYNNGTKELRPLEPGNTVRFHPSKYSQQWTPATVVRQVGVCSYQVITDDGRVYCRNCQTCVSKLKPLNNHLLMWRYVALILVPCP